MAYEALPAHFRTDFSTTWEARIARRESDFYRLVKTVPLQGEKKRYNQSEILDMQRKTGRAQKTRISERATYFRWLLTHEADLAETLDEFDGDNLGDIALPDSDIMSQHVDAYNREVDATIKEAVEGLATVGENGTNTQAVTQVVDSDYDDGTNDSGLSLKKVIRVNRYFKDNDLKRAVRCFAFDPEAEDNLLLTAEEVKSSDYVIAGAIAAGTMEGIGKWMGFEWVLHTGLTEVAGGGGQGGNIVKNLAWAKDQIRFGDGQRRAYADILPQQSHALQIRTACRMGAYRNEEKGVVICNSLITA
jgi:hypothetical protein